MILRTERFREIGRSADGTPEIGAIYPDAFDIRHFGVRQMPERWAPWECARLIGDMFTDKLRFPCPAATMLCLVYPDREGASAKAGFKFMRTTSLSQSKSARFLPKLSEQSSEWSHVQAELQAGKRLVQLFYGVTSYSPLGLGDAHERSIKAIYKAAGWDLADERFLQLHGLIAAMPMTLADGLPLCFFLILSGWDLFGLFMHLDNLSVRYLQADAVRRLMFSSDLKIMFFAATALIAALRMPGFIARIASDIPKRSKT